MYFPSVCESANAVRLALSGRGTRAPHFHRRSPEVPRDHQRGYAPSQSRRSLWLPRERTSETRPLAHFRRTKLAEKPCRVSRSVQVSTREPRRDGASTCYGLLVSFVRIHEAEGALLALKHIN